jgi:uncharacterized membrane protein YfcA
MTPDMINGAFEFFGGLFLLRNCWLLYRDKQVKGVSIAATTFFTVWGTWNIFFYIHLDQWVSFVGAVLIAVSNSLWIALALYYSRKQHERTERISGATH